MLRVGLTTEKAVEPQDTLHGPGKKPRSSLRQKDVLFLEVARIFACPLPIGFSGSVRFLQTNIAT